MVQITNDLGINDIHINVSNDKSIKKSKNDNHNKNIHKNKETIENIDNIDNIETTKIIETKNGFFKYSKVSKKLIDNEKFNCNEEWNDIKDDMNWEVFDESCKRKNVKLSYNELYDIFQELDIPTSKKYNPIKMNEDIDFTTHFVRYNVKDNYKIDEHDDFCKMTILIYLNKDENMDETFYIDNNKINDPWISTKNEDNKYGALVFWGNIENPSGLEHWGELIGNGQRNIIAIFVN